MAVGENAGGGGGGLLTVVGFFQQSVNSLLDALKCGNEWEEGATKNNEGTNTENVTMICTLISAINGKLLIVVDGAPNWETNAHTIGAAIQDVYSMVGAHFDEQKLAVENKLRALAPQRIGQIQAGVNQLFATETDAQKRALAMFGHLMKTIGRMQLFGKRQNVNN